MGFCHSPLAPSSQRLIFVSPEKFSQIFFFFLFFLWTSQADTLISFFKIIYLLIDFWLRWVFVAARGLSLVAASRAALRCGAWVSYCCGFSCCGAQALGAWASVVVARRLQLLHHAGSVVVAHGLQSAGSVAVAHGLSCSAACGIFLDQGSNTCPLHWQADS